nr:MAG TPA: hypothetical protein [Caudoviricetes sp.]
MSIEVCRKFRKMIELILSLIAIAFLINGLYIVVRDLVK